MNRILTALRCSVSEKKEGAQVVLRAFREWVGVLADSCARLGGLAPFLHRPLDAIHRARSAANATGDGLGLFSRAKQGPDSFVFLLAKVGVSSTVGCSTIFCRLASRSRVCIVVGTCDGVSAHL